MTIDEHIRRQEAGELPEGYPVRVGNLLKGGRAVEVWAERLWGPPIFTTDPIRAIRELEAEVVEAYRKRVDAINKCRKQRGEKLL